MKMHTDDPLSHLCVQVQIVTFNSASSLPACLQAVLAQSLQPNQILVIDNASRDDSIEVAKSFGDDILIIRNPINCGYAGGHNQGFRLAANDGTNYVLTLNPDVILEVDYLEKLLKSVVGTQNIGGVTGKLIRIGMSSSTNQTSVIDSAGLVMNSLFHVRDRGSGLPDDGRWNNPKAVWGVCGAAALYNVKMLEDVSLGGEFLDETFFLYKEDVDLCWRAKRRGWSFFCESLAKASHERGWSKGTPPHHVAESHSFANQIALLVRHAPHQDVWGIVKAIMVETARWLLLLLSRPSIAYQVTCHIKGNWAHNFRIRRQLRTMDNGKASDLVGISRPCHL